MSDKPTPKLERTWPLCECFRNMHDRCRGAMLEPFWEHAVAETWRADEAEAEAKQLEDYGHGLLTALENERARVAKLEEALRLCMPERCEYEAPSEQPCPGTPEFRACAHHEARALLAHEPEARPDAAGSCTDCGGPVFHREGKPGEFDHECGHDAEEKLEDGWTVGPDGNPRPPLAGHDAAPDKHCITRREGMRDADMPLAERVEAALQRIKDGRAPMRIPVEATDLDVVLCDLREHAAAETRAKLEAYCGNEPCHMYDDTRCKVHEERANFEVRRSAYLAERDEVGDRNTRAAEQRADEAEAKLREADEAIHCGDSLTRPCKTPDDPCWDHALHVERERTRELVEALRELVHANEQWNADVEKIIGRPPNWSDAYLDKARALLARHDAEEKR